MCKSFSCTNTVDYLSPVWVRLRKHTGKYRSNQVCRSVIHADPVVVVVVVVHETTIGKLGGETGRIKGDADKGSRVFGLMVNSHHVNVGEFLWLVVLAGVPGQGDTAGHHRYCCCFSPAKGITVVEHVLMFC